MRKWILGVLVVMLTLSTAGCQSINITFGETPENQPSTEEPTEKIKKTIIATTFAAYDWTKTIIKGSDNVEVIFPVNNNLDLHSYHRTSKDVDVCKNADLIIALSEETEDWLRYTGIKSDHIIYLMDTVDKIESSPDLRYASKYDEHIWLSLKNAKKCVNTIKEAVSGLDSINTELYSYNALEYVKKLNNLDEKYQEAVNASKNKTLIFADRFPFQYMANDYGLDCYAAFPGCSSDTEISYDTIELLAEKLDESNLKNLCCIVDNDDVVKAIVDESSHSDIGIVVIESMQSISNKEADELSYLDIMEDNLDMLKEGLKLRSAENRPGGLGDPWVIFIGGDGKIITETKVWEIEDTYYYENYTTESTAYGTLEWDELFNDSGYAKTKEDLMTIIDERGETTFLYEGKAHMSGEFANDKWENNRKDS